MTDIAGQVAAVAGAVVAVGGALGVAARGGRWLVRRGRQLGHLIDDLLGEPERPGQPERPSLMARIARIEKRTEAIEKRLDAHIRQHEGGAYV